MLGKFSEEGRAYAKVKKGDGAVVARTGRTNQVRGRRRRQSLLEPIKNVQLSGATESCSQTCYKTRSDCSKENRLQRARRVLSETGWHVTAERPGAPGPLERKERFEIHLTVGLSGPDV